MTARRPSHSTSRTEPDLAAPVVVLLTGMSGAGRSTAANALEDMGWFVVDNMPPELLPRLVELAGRGGSDVTKIAAVADVRSGEFFAALQDALESVERHGVIPRVIFLEADDDSIVRRFEASRRPHPLQAEGRLVDAVVKERELLRELRGRADLLIDTSDLNVNQLRRRVEEAFASDEGEGIQVTVMSFGFKYGLPVDADLVVDCRFLPNPYWDLSLRELSGLEAAVSDYVLGQPAAKPFLDAYLPALDIVLRGYAQENKRYVTLAVGCTGGKHRSVAIAEEISRRIGKGQNGKGGVASRVVHRDLGRE